jgi:predicted PurR-regulated permease PerM
MAGLAPTWRQVAAALLLALAAAAGAYLLLVELSRYIAVFFCSMLAALALDAAARRLTFGGRLPQALAVGLALIGLLLVGGALGWWVGPQLMDQFDALTEQVPRGLDTARRWLERSPIGERSLELPDLQGGASEARAVLEEAGSFLGAGFAVVADSMIFLIVTLFLAADPERYTRGAVRLLSEQHRGRALELLSAAGTALRRWLLARGLLMLLVAVLFGVGLLVLEVPLAVPLAVLAGAFSFVPYLGPAAALIPAFAVALLQSPTRALYVVALYLAVQLLETYVVEPLVEARAVSLPPALIIVSQVISAVWLGPVGVLIATPLLVVVVVSLQILYVRGVLSEPVEVIGS